MEKLVFTRMNLSDVRVIITITRVPVKDLLCQTVMGRILVLECHCQKCVDACHYGLSCQTLNGAIFRVSDSSDAYPVLKSPQAWMLWARVCVEPGHEHKAGWADR
jgi:hypothetical protein